MGIMCCAVVIRDDVYTRRNRRAHPTAHATSTLSLKDPIFSYNSTPRTSPRLDYGSKGGNYSVLPDISTMSPSSRIEGFSQYALTELQEITLKNNLVRSLRETSERTLQTMLANLRAQDRDRDGVLSLEQVSTTLKKYQSTLSEETQKNLCQKFFKMEDRYSLVNYEAMVNFMAKMRMQALKGPPVPPPEYESSYIPEGNVSSRSSRRSTWNSDRLVNYRNKTMFSDEDEVALIKDLEKQLLGRPTNISDLRRTFYALDRERNDFLTAPQVDNALRRCGFYLTPDVRARLLLATDRTGAGMHKIENLLNYITRVTPEDLHAIQMNNYKHREASLRRHPATLGEPALVPPWNEGEGPINMQELNSESEFIQDESCKDSETISPSQPFDRQKWTNDYQYLIQALFQADVGSTGYLPPGDVKRTVNAYAIVYGLGLSEETITSALEKTVDEKFNEISLSDFIVLLHTLHMRTVIK